VRRLYALFHEYEPAQVEQAIAHASEYDLFDAKRLEAILLNEAGVTLFNFPESRVMQPHRRRPASEGWVTPPHRRQDEAAADRETTPTPAPGEHSPVTGGATAPEEDPDA
jgi:hypothetical protein